MSIPLFLFFFAAADSLPAGFAAAAFAGRTAANCGAVRTGKSFFTTQNKAEMQCNTSTLLFCT
jgi:hypothetical protein